MKLISLLTIAALAGTMPLFAAENTKAPAFPLKSAAAE